MILRLKIEFVPYPFVVRGQREEGDRRSRPTAAWVASPYQLLARYRDPPLAILEFLAEGSGPLGAVPTCILTAAGFETRPYQAHMPAMHARRARSTTKIGFPMAFSGPLASESAACTPRARADSRVCPYRCRDVTIENRIRAMCVYGSRTDGEKGDRRSPLQQLEWRGPATLLWQAGIPR